MIGKVIEPEFIDLEKTRVKFKIVSENGITSNAELMVPKDQAKGENPYWDQILENFDVQEMRRRRNEKETLVRKQKEAEDKKRKAHEENIRLTKLFNKKMEAFNLPYINEGASELKAAIRRSPTSQVLDIILTGAALDFMKENNMTYIDYLDYLDDLEDKKQAEKEAST